MFHLKMVYSVRTGLPIHLDTPDNLVVTYHLIPWYNV